LLPEAEADLRAIIRYTRAEWGDAQTRNYVAKLTRCIENIAGSERTGMDLSDIHPGLRVVHCQHHYISACRAKMPPRWWLRFCTNGWI